MRIFPVIVKRTTVESGGSGGGFIASIIEPALALTNRFGITAFSVLPGVSIDATRQANRIAVNPAVDVDLKGATGTADNEVHTPGILTGARISDYKKEAAVEANIVQVTYGLVKRIGAASNVAVGTAFGTPANANGLSGAGNATCAGSLGGNAQGIELSYADSLNKSELTITEARLFLYMEVSDLAVPLSSTVVSYNIGGGLVTLETIAPASGWDNLPTPREYDLTAIVNTWAKFDAFVCRIVITFAAASNLVTGNLDAVELRVTANKTDTIG